GARRGEGRLGGRGARRGSGARDRLRRGRGTVAPGGGPGVFEETGRGGQRQGGEQPERVSGRTGRAPGDGGNGEAHPLARLGDARYVGVPGNVHDAVLRGGVPGVGPAAVVGDGVRRPHPYLKLSRVVNFLDIFIRRGVAAADAG